MSLFKKNFKKQFKEETQIEFKNVPFDLKFNPEKEYQVSIFYDGTSNLVTYKTTQRSLADKYFKDFASKNDGYVESKFANVLK